MIRPYACVRTPDKFPALEPFEYFTTMKFEGARARKFVRQFFFVPILVFFRSQKAVKKFGPKIGFFLVWTSHLSGIPTTVKPKRQRTVGEMTVFAPD
jgi:hypothetical protein